MINLEIGIIFTPANNSYRCALKPAAVIAELEWTFRRGGCELIWCIPSLEQLALSSLFPRLEKGLPMFPGTGTVAENNILFSV